MRSYWLAAIVFTGIAPLPARAQAHDFVFGTGLQAAPHAEIDDPSSGVRWLLYSPANGGPGRLVPVALSLMPGASRAVEPGVPLPVIRAGDRILVEEHTATVDAQLEATALNPAATGGAVRVRLVIGGRIVPAIALARGRARLLPEEVHP